MAANSCSRSLNARRTSPELAPERFEPEDFVLGATSARSCARLFEDRLLEDRPFDVRAVDDRLDVDDRRERDCEVAID
jgi:hypothetical protein